jgi:hypothetical protein
MAIKSSVQLFHSFNTFFHITRFKPVLIVVAITTTTTPRYRWVHRIARLCMLKQLNDVINECPHFKCVLPFNPVRISKSCSTIVFLGTHFRNDTVHYCKKKYILHTPVYRDSIPLNSPPSLILFSSSFPGSVTNTVVSHHCLFRLICH